MRDELLWQSINNFKIDDPDSNFSFSKRLARDNNWSSEFAQRAIEEYKKFIYLCCICKEPITPSDSVDQVWHLHLTYTKSYWIDLCKNTIKKQIHHNPTKGGQSERSKFKNCYDKTFEEYIKEFRSHPPKDIWLNNQDRFTQINFKRLNIDNYWLLKKPDFLLKKKFVLPLFSIFPLFLLLKSDIGIIKFLIIVAVLVILLIFSKNKNNNNDDGCWDDGCDTGCSGCSGCGD